MLSASAPFRRVPLRTSGSSIRVPFSGLLMIERNLWGKVSLKTRARGSGGYGVAKFPHELGLLSFSRSSEVLDHRPDMITNSTITDDAEPSAIGLCEPRAGPHRSHLGPLLTGFFSIEFGTSHHFG